MVLFASALSLCSCQVEQGIPTHLLTGDLNFTLGNIDNVNSPGIIGFEMNFWGLPSFSAAGSENFMRICDDITLDIVYAMSGTELAI